MRAIARVVDWVSAPYTVCLILKDKQVSRWPKIGAVLLFVALFAYMALPFDIIPDAVPFSGWLDDILAVTLVMFTAGKVLPQARLKEKSQAAGNNVKRALIIIAAWVLMVTVLALSTLAALIIIIVKLAGG
jgi:uncharacterized membrane protein YkvA (DUF1232 family)